MNEADKKFVEALKAGCESEYVHFDTISTDVSRLISIIERQAKAIEKCKEQRDDWIKACDLAEYKTALVKRITNEELDAVLDGEEKA